MNLLSDTSSSLSRKRVFPHERGNWATFVYIPIEADHLSTFGKSIKALLKEKYGTESEVLTEFHVSLSKTVTIGHHNISCLSNCLKNAISGFPCFDLQLNEAQFYQNDEKSRSFLGLRCLIGAEFLYNISTAVNRVFSEFNLPSYKFGDDSPEFHVSFLWGNEQMVSAIDGDLLEQVQEIYDEFITNSTYDLDFFVNSVHLKVGNKFFKYDLQQ